MQQVFGWMSQVVLAFALPYFAISVALGTRVATRGGLKLGSQEQEEPEVEPVRHYGSPATATITPTTTATAALALTISGDRELA